MCKNCGHYLRKPRKELPTKKVWFIKGGNFRWKERRLKV
jgi:hypothetical protein